MTPAAGSAAAGGAGPAGVVALVSYDRVDELDLAGAYEVLAKAHAAVGSAPAPVVVGPRAGRPVAGSNGLALVAQAGYAELRAATHVVVPGGAGAEEAAAGGDLRRELAAAWERGVPFYAVCSGALLLARAGLLAGRAAAIHAGKGALLVAAGAASAAAGYVDDGRLRSIGGRTAATVKSVDLACRLLAEYCPEALEHVAARLEIDVSFARGVERVP